MANVPLSPGFCLYGLLHFETAGFEIGVFQEVCMDAEILAVGTELLMGQIANTNAQYISSRLPDAGINVYYHSVVGDNPVRLKDAVKRALQRSDAVIMTGGLGPTQDDLTKETVAEVLGRKMVLNEECLKKIEEFFRRTGRVMSENNKRQAYFPEGSIILDNGTGTAPGCIVETDGKVVIMLPGPPSEMKPMFERYVMPYFLSKSEYVLHSVYVRIFGIGESMVESMLMDLIDAQTNPTLATYAREGEVTLRVTARCRRDEDPEPVLKPVIDEISARLGDNIFSTDGRSLEQVTADLLIKKGVSIAVAESCTAGMICSRLGDIPGISAVFNRGFVTYSNEAKVENLGVSMETLMKHGAVSRETALEMARGARKAAGTHIGVSVTGIAGPGGGTPEKPVGTVFMALSDGAYETCRELHLWGDRAKIRNLSALNAFDMIRRYLLSKYGND